MRYCSEYDEYSFPKDYYISSPIHDSFALIVVVVVVVVVVLLAGGGFFFVRSRW